MLHDTSSILIDTHCHLNFKDFAKNLPEVIDQAKTAGVAHITVPGTDIESSKKAIEIAEENEGIYAAVGIHPHHAFELVAQDKNHVAQEIEELDNLIQDCVSRYGDIALCPIKAIGEIGIDRHVYEKTKYENYHINESFIKTQSELFVEQLKLAKKFGLSVIIHNREAKEVLLPLLKNNWSDMFEWRTVFHCCEPDMELLEFALKHNIFIGVDGDVTYFPSKAEFIKKAPLENLVLETDSPFLRPRIENMEKLKYPNTPHNLKLIAQFVADLREVPFDVLANQTTNNSKKLFHLEL